MLQQPLLSILLTVSNQRDIVEPTLTAILEAESISFELIIIDDASTDGSRDAIQSLLDYYEHESTFYFEHEEMMGRGLCLNEALQQASGKVIWAPLSVQKLDENLLTDRIEELLKSDALYSLNSESLPTESSNFSNWDEFIQAGSWPHDGTFLWNRERIPGSDFFFNPSISAYLGVELASRLTSGTSLRYSESFYSSSDFEAAAEVTNNTRLEICYNLLRHYSRSKAERDILVGRIEYLAQRLDLSAKKTEFDKLIEEAYRMKKEGSFSSALEIVEKLLKEHPDRPESKQLKIEILEKKRRFVEASELKHELQGKGKVHEAQEEIHSSIIIPTTAYGKPALEQSLVSIEEHCSPKETELIVIDNASLDDTHDYLEELKAKNFFNCRIITNKKNKGFAASVNQGLEIARGDYACIMHNDVQLRGNAIGELQKFMELYPNYAILGPMADKTLNPDQSTRVSGEHSGDITRAEYLDSFCMMIRLDTNLRMDEAYQLCFFEDIDFCFQARKDGHRVGIATGIAVEHHYGTTTFALNLDTESEEYWKNVAYFNDKWGIEVYSEEELKSKSTFDQLLAIDELVNPLYPEESLKQHFNKLFTDELKTEILKSEYDDETLCKLVHLMMVMDEREVMRRLEDRLDNVELPASLIYQLVRFYFKRNIYSRCMHYLKQLKAEQQSLQSELYKLEIMVREKELEKAIPKLKELLDQAPTNPTLYKLAGDIYEFEGNEEEAESFYNIARQINPYKFSDEEDTELEKPLL